MEWRLTETGRQVLVLTLGAALVGWVGPSLARPLAALGGASLLAAALLAFARIRALEVSDLRPARGAVGSPLPLRLSIASSARLFRPSDLFFALGERGAGPPKLAGFLSGPLGSAPRVVDLMWRVRRRGRHERFQVRVSSAAPLGLVAVTRDFEVPGDVLGLPRRGRLSGLLGARPAGSHPARGRLSRGEEELSHVRDWRPGESLHRIHWRLSARRGRPILRELCTPAEPDVQLLLRTTTVGGLGFGGRREASFERAVSLAATLADHYLRQGRRLTLSVEGEKSLRALRGRAGLARALTHLALVSSEARASTGGEGSPEAARLPGHQLVTVLAGSGREESVASVAGDRVFDVDARRGHPHHAPWHDGLRSPMRRR